MRVLMIIALSILLLPNAVSAQSSRYSTWADPTASSAPNPALDKLVAELNKLIDKAEKAKAADPTFLQDLRNLTNAQRAPSQKLLVSDAFADGDYTNNPAWQVVSGEYFIESGWGLRNRLITANPQTSSNTSGNSGEDFAKAILGQLLKQATKTPSQPAASSENLITLSTPISNAFDLEVEMSSWLADSHFELGVFQGEQALIGYRLLYISGKGIQLHRVGNAGSSVIATSSQAITIEDKDFHTIIWSRSGDGSMRVSLDGTNVITTSDRGFSDPFDGVRISDKGGDFIIKQVKVSGS